MLRERYDGVGMPLDKTELLHPLVAIYIGVPLIRVQGSKIRNKKHIDAVGSRRREMPHHIEHHILPADWIERQAEPIRAARLAKHSDFERSAKVRDLLPALLRMRLRRE